MAAGAAAALSEQLSLLEKRVAELEKAGPQTKRENGASASASSPPPPSPTSSVSTASPRTPVAPAEDVLALKARLPVGCFVFIQGLSGRKELNGSFGVVQKYVTPKGQPPRVLVRIAGGAHDAAAVALREDNAHPVPKQLVRSHLRLQAAVAGAAECLAAAAAAKTRQWFFALWRRRVQRRYVRLRPEGLGSGRWAVQALGVAPRDCAFTTSASCGWSALRFLDDNSNAAWEAVVAGDQSWLQLHLAAVEFRPLELCLRHYAPPASGSDAAEGYNAAKGSVPAVVHCDLSHDGVNFTRLSSVPVTPLNAHALKISC